MKLAQLIAQTGEQEAVIQVLCYLLSAERTAVFLMPDIDDAIAERALSYIERYKKGTPLAYMFGYAYFNNRKFLVDHNVLVPRHDTEILIELAEKKIITDSMLGYPDHYYRVLDLCCGSGIIGVSLALLCNWLREKDPSNHYLITASDISQKALAVARSNADLHEVDIEFICSDLFENIRGCFDLIVCNPPYVRTFDIGVEDPSTLKEPRIALDGGMDGLYYYRLIINQLRRHMNVDGMIMFEVGYDQAESVREIAENYGFTKIKIYKDLANHDRVVTISL